MLMAQTWQPERAPGAAPQQGYQHQQHKGTAGMQTLPLLSRHSAAHGVSVCSHPPPLRALGCEPGVRGKQSPFASEGTATPTFLFLSA